MLRKIFWFTASNANILFSKLQQYGFWYFHGRVRTGTSRAPRKLGVFIIRFVSGRSWNFPPNICFYPPLMGTPAARVLCHCGVGTAQRAVRSVFQRESFSPKKKLMSSQENWCLLVLHIFLGFLEIITKMCPCHFAAVDFQRPGDL